MHKCLTKSAKLSRNSKDGTVREGMSNTFLMISTSVEWQSVKDSRAAFFNFGSNWMTCNKSLILKYLKISFKCSSFKSVILVCFRCAVFRFATNGTKRFSSSILERWNFVEETLKLLLVHPNEQWSWFILFRNGEESTHNFSIDLICNLIG